MLLNGGTSGPGTPFCDTWEERICPEVEQGRDGFRAAFPIIKNREAFAVEFKMIAHYLRCGLIEELEKQRRSCESEERFYDYMHMVNFLEDVIDRAESFAKDDAEYKERRALEELKFGQNLTHKQLKELPEQLKTSVLQMLKESTRG